MKYTKETTPHLLYLRKTVWKTIFHPANAVHCTISLVEKCNTHHWRLPAKYCPTLLTQTHEDFVDDLQCKKRDLCDRQPCLNLDFSSAVTSLVGFFRRTIWCGRCPDLHLWRQRRGCGWGRGIQSSCSRLVPGNQHNKYGSRQNIGGFFTLSPFKSKDQKQSRQYYFIILQLNLLVEV